MSRILTITNFDDFQFIEQTREENQIRHVPSNTFVSTPNPLSTYTLLTNFFCIDTVEETLRIAYIARGGTYA